ncbi:putative E3 ubiquitin-protein ligase HERC4 [Glycine soja]|uniref:Putative E3 ubiquitin-protein ligase HERC4 n=1 Tax=Glycine soja TaxID=3848 RepID=A0A445HY34_GLYSO|nr:Putative E3 ubiquitin-protein ligase HERC4 [Glycine soja]RZB78721.1 putative E3 ubiquitin-protein ligase HERC4 [Glycine soja]
MDEHRDVFPRWQPGCRWIPIGVRIDAYEPTPVSALPSHILSVHAGHYHSLWAWGRNNQAQLARGPSSRSRLDGGMLLLVLRMASCLDGGYSADALADLEAAEKRVLQGMEQENNMPIVWEPRLVEELHGVHVLDIACGLDHSLILCRDGVLLSCGSNVKGSDIHWQYANSVNQMLVWGLQTLLHGDGKVPSLIDALDGENPVSVSEGRAHSLALTSKGKLWVWGSGTSGRLGLGSSADQVEPFCVDSLERFQILQALSGFDHNLVLVAG